MKKILIPLAILASLGAILYFKNKSKTEEAQEPDFAPPMPDSKEYLKSQSIAEQKPFRTDKEKTLTNMQDSLRPEKKPILSDRDISELSKKALYAQTGRTGYRDKKEQQSFIQKVMASVKNKQDYTKLGNILDSKMKDNIRQNTTQVPYGMPEQSNTTRPLNPLNLGANEQGKRRSQGMIRIDFDDSGNPLTPPSIARKPDGLEDYRDDSSRRQVKSSRDRLAQSRGRLG